MPEAAGADAFAEVAFDGIHAGTWRMFGDGGLFGGVDEGAVRARGNEIGC